MNPSRLSIILIDDDARESLTIQEMLAAGNFTSLSVASAGSLAGGLEYLATKAFDLILLSLSLPDSQGLDTFLRVRALAPDSSIIVLTGSEAELDGVQAVQAGAQDYLVRGQLTGSLLIRAVRYALERNRMQLALRTTSWTDDLTQLYNRRGFLAVAAQYLKLVQRMQKGLLLFYIDLDKLQAINDRYGFQIGDQHLTATAQILQKTFRSSDILARLGGDEFAVLVLGAPAGSAARLIQRLRANLEKHNDQTEAARQIALSIGAMEFDTSAPANIEDWLTQANQARLQHPH